eukprot:1157582-Pelagomonas_calceolata.AAC.1
MHAGLPNVIRAYLLQARLCGGEVRHSTHHPPFTLQAKAKQRLWPRRKEEGLIVQSKGESASPNKSKCADDLGPGMLRAVYGYKWTSETHMLACFRAGSFELARDQENDVWQENRRKS